MYILMCAKSSCTGWYSGSWVFVGCPQAGSNWTTKPFLPPRASKTHSGGKTVSNADKTNTVSRQQRMPDAFDRGG